MVQKFSILNGVLLGAIQTPSPNFNTREQSVILDLLVIHNISLPPARFGGGYIEQFFQNKLNIEQDPFFTEIANLKVSAHLLVNRAGEVTQFVNFNDRAWHAGVSSYQGRENCNDFSIGIELEGTDDMPFEDCQYQVLAKISALLEMNYPAINVASALGHSQIAPGRKTDPGKCFDWSHYQALWNEYIK
ncbi:MAG: 1,6-anhydro-N-acetylmuramyl-L-alanine amidase AmpD [Oceanospirillaceae bacterium]